MTAIISHSAIRNVDKQFGICGVLNYITPMKVTIGPYRSNRKICVRIDKYDTWNMDNTLSMIIVPMLKQLRATKKGIPGEFSGSESQQLQFDFMDEDCDVGFDRGVERWEATLDKMIWAFEQIMSDDWPRYGVPNDYNGSRADYRRDIQSGIDLFAKYYLHLWD